MEQDFDKVIVVGLERLSQVFRALLWDYAKQEKLSPIQIQFLIYIGLHPEGKSRVTEIARTFNLTPATVSDAVKSLIEKGLVTKKINSMDRRKINLSLTSCGRNVAENLSGWQNSFFQILKSFPLQTKQTVSAFFLELLEALRSEGIAGEIKTCLSCSYYRTDDEREQSIEHFCLLRDIQISNIDLRLDCPHYKDANNRGN